MKSISHFFLYCHCSSDICPTLLNDLKSIDENILSQEDNRKVEILLYGNTKFDSNRDYSLLNSSLNYILKLQRFGGSLSS